MSKKPRLVFVGNGMMKNNLQEFVDRSHCVVRSQRCGVNYQGKAGRKTDVLCLRPDNEPFGKELAREKSIPRDAAADCHSVIMIQRHNNPKTKVLFLNYPTLQYKPLLMLNEEPARQLLLARGAADKKQHKLINPTLGMVVLLHWMHREFHHYYDIKCVGFSWGFGRWKEHHPDIEQQIQREWEGQGLLEFVE